MAIRIENPTRGGSEWTTVKRARKFIGRLLADWVIPGVSIRFRDEARQKQAHFAVRRGELEAARIEADRVTHRQVASAKAIHGVPVTKPRDLLAPSPRRYFASDRAVWKNRQGRTDGERAFVRRAEEARRGK